MPSQTYTRPRPAPLEARAENGASKQKPDSRLLTGPASNGVRTRKATAKDFPGIRKLIREYPDKLMQNHLPKPAEFFVAIEDGKIVGCCALEIYSKRLAEIRSLAVTKRFQNCGIATELVNACMAAARKKKIYELLAIVGSEKFLAKFGFHAFNKEKYALINILGN